MAYVSNPTDPNDPNALNPQQDAGVGQEGAPGPQTSSGIGGDSASTTAGSPQGTASVANSAKAPPVQDLGAYLRANASQAVQMGQKIAGNLNETAQKAIGDVDTAQQNVNAGVNAQYIAPNADLVGRAASDPNAFVQNPDDVRAFQAQRDAAYTGPANFESTPDFSNANASVNSAISKAPDVTQESGIHQLVRGQEKNPTLGMENLDALLLQGTPAALAPIQEAVPQFGTLKDYLSGKAGETNKNIQKTITDAQSANAGVQDKFLTGANAVVPEWEKALTGKLVPAQKQADNYNEAINKIISQQNELNPLVAKEKAAEKAANDLLGGAQPYWTSDFSSLTKPPPAPLVNSPTLQNISTPEDYQRESALEQLLGTGLGTTPINQSTASQAGTYQVPGQTPSLDWSGSQASYDELARRLANMNAPNPFPGLKLLPTTQPLKDSANALMEYLKGLK